MSAWEWSATGTRWRTHHAGGVEIGAARAVAAAVEAGEQRWSRFREDTGGAPERRLARARETS